MTFVPLPSGFQLLFLLVFAAAAVASAVLVRPMIRLSHKLKLLDHPSDIKVHRAPMPLLGGFAIFIAFWTAVYGGIGFLALLTEYAGSLSQWWMGLEGARPLLPKLAGIFVGSLLIFFVGLFDAQYNLPPWVKLLGQMGAAAILILAGLTISGATIFGPASHVATFLWIILIVNAFNFIDSIDGHCAGIALISCVFFFWITQLIEQPVMGLFVMALAGSIFGFLPFNFKPARIFLGDNGSLFIGYMLAAITLLLTYKEEGARPLSPLIPVFMFGVPIYDTLSVVTARVLRGVAPWKGDRNHFAHRLVRLGMSERVATLFSYFVAITLGHIAILSTQISTAIGIVTIMILFVSIVGIIAFMEYYSAARLQIMEDLKRHHKRRREDIRDAEEKRF